MGVNSLPKTVTRQRRGRDLNPGPFALESSTLTTRLPSHHAEVTTDGNYGHYGSAVAVAAVNWNFFKVAEIFPTKIKKKERFNRLVFSVDLYYVAHYRRQSASVGEAG